ncbi:hypothetical protein ACOT81_37930 [Streptomyces sp. WI04-05B]|uniref:hypothetical protein n=1 Tax=Streptomyces TaxID=1883 RepID=UPI0029BAA703|nr:MULTISPECIES: hypothetical protein [unclassified Streptomyces]MDX2545845.1 hypothetical protein [Streptomyces sp. WI04-05B]MDX2586404.1 hypothetical protein [Streptomyces sp. WI04-05A]
MQKCTPGPQPGGLSLAQEQQKDRKGTRFGRDDGPTDTRGGKARLDIDRIVGTDRWLDDIVGTLARALAGIAHGLAE